MLMFPLFVSLSLDTNEYSESDGQEIIRLSTTQVHERVDEQSAPLQYIHRGMKYDKTGYDTRIDIVPRNNRVVKTDFLPRVYRI